MKRRYTVKPKRTFRENLKIVIPEIFDDFYSVRNSVIYHPRTKDKLHRMRIAGKPLRYIMEIGEGAFGQEFKNCLDEYKNTIELLGDIHDGDVIIPELNQHLKEIRNFNKTLSARKEHLSTKGIRDMISHFRKKRNEDFIKFREQIEKWENEDFRSRLLNSMEP